MTWLATLLLALMAAQTTTSGIHGLTTDVEGVGRVLYGLSIPRGYNDNVPAPLIVALHPGGNMPYYGRDFMKLVMEPGLRDLKAIIVAPDCPAGSWEDPRAEQVVLALVADAMSHYNIDKRRVLVAGFSMGGRGTWWMSAKHPEIFTAAIPMAASTGDHPLDMFGSLPTYVIHSRDDERVPFAPAERNARQLARTGKPVHFEAVSGLTHFEMYRYVDVLRSGARWVADKWAASARASARQD
jgi:predicted peptidase